MEKIVPVKRGSRLGGVTFRFSLYEKVSCLCGTKIGHLGFVLFTSGILIWLEVNFQPGRHEKNYLIFLNNSFFTVVAIIILGKN